MTPVRQSSSCVYIHKYAIWRPLLCLYSIPGHYMQGLENLEPLIFAILLSSRIALWEKIRDPCESRLDLMVLRTMIRSLLMVPYFPLNLNYSFKNWNEQRTGKETDYWFYGLTEVGPMVELMMS